MRRRMLSFALLLCALILCSFAISGWHHPPPLSPFFEQELLRVEGGDIVETTYGFILVMKPPRHVRDFIVYWRGCRTFNEFPHLTARYAIRVHKKRDLTWTSAVQKLLGVY